MPNITTMTLLVQTKPAEAKAKIIAAFRRYGIDIEGKGAGGRGGKDRMPPSIARVAEDFGVTAETVRRWCRRLGIGTFGQLARALGEASKRVKKAE